MNYVELKLQFADSASLRLLRADNAPLVLTVLFAAFKHEHSSSVPESRLQAVLEAELEELRDTNEAVADKKAKDYLLEWADQAHGYLRRHQPDGKDEPVFELTPEVEQVFQWFETLKPKTHVGTESKFKSLAAVLREIVENSTRDPDVRIQRLKEEQAKLQQQIEEIERTGEVTLYNSTQVNERFASVLETSRKLLGDFREVERHFRRVTENISVQQATEGSTRGDIVGQTLDAQEQLRKSSQGQSFYAFWDFLLAPERRRQFTELVEQAYSLPELADELRDDTLLRKLQASLRAEGNKVVTSNERLVAQLRRVLDIRESAERREVGRLIQEIKSLAHQTRELPPQTELLEIDAGMTLVSLMSKSPWSPPENVEFGSGLVVSEGGDYREALEAFLRLHPVDFERLRQNIRDCLQTRVQITLPELLELRPPRNGILEVLAYLLIAESDGPHIVLEAFDLIELSGQPELRYRVPQIVFFQHMNPNPPKTFPSAAVKVRLLQDAVYSDDAELWATLLRYHSPHLENYFQEIGLELVVHEEDGFAYLKQAEQDDTAMIPRLFRRDKLTKGVAIIGVALRERLLQFDEKVHDESRLIVEKDEIIQMVAPFFPETNDEIKADKRIEGTITKAEEMGLLRKLPAGEGVERYEVRRVIKARFPVETLKALREQLEAHANTRDNQ